MLMTKNATISFHSHTFLENIDAVNNSVMAVIDGTKKNIAFSLFMKQFDFPKKLMQTHFNENYVESDKFPKATFSGVITSPSAVNFSKDGTYNVTVEGDLTIKGRTQKVKAPATIVVAGKTLKTNASFNIKLADIGVEGQPITAGKVSAEPKISVSAELN